MLCEAGVMQPRLRSYDATLSAVKRLRMRQALKN